MILTREALTAEEVRCSSEEVSVMETEQRDERCNRYKFYQYIVCQNGTQQPLPEEPPKISKEQVTANI